MNNFGKKQAVYKGKAKQTKGGLTSDSIILKTDSSGNKRYKSKNQSGSKNPDWTESVKKARSILLKSGDLEPGVFVPIGGSTKAGKLLLKTAREIYSN